MYDGKYSCYGQYSIKKKTLISVMGRMCSSMFFKVFGFWFHNVAKGVVHVVSVLHRSVNRRLPDSNCSGTVGSGGISWEPSSPSDIVLLGRRLVVGDGHFCEHRVAGFTLLLCHSNIMLRNGPPLGETPNTVTCHSADLHVQGETGETKGSSSSPPPHGDAQ